VSEDYIPFEKALRDLKMSEDELKRLVSADEIQAMRSPDGTIRLRREDVEALASKDDAEELAEELVFADDLDSEDTGMVTAVLEDDSLLEEEETLDLAPEELEVEIEEDDVIPASPSRRTSATPVRSRGRAAAIRQTGTPDDEEKPLDKVIMVVGAIILTYALFFAYSITQGKNTGMTRWLAESFKVEIK